MHWRAALSGELWVVEHDVPVGLASAHHARPGLPERVVHLLEAGDGGLGVDDAQRRRVSWERQQAFASLDVVAQMTGGHAIAVPAVNDRLRGEQRRHWLRSGADVG